MSKCLIVITTVSNKEIGQEIAKSILEERLAACITISSSSISSYWWKDEITQEEEFILFIKTMSALFPQLKEKIVELHPYEIPEVIALPITDGYEKYLDWIEQETGG
jgi:periplasmic divalent cation tolerance protein